MKSESQLKFNSDGSLNIPGQVRRNIAKQKEEQMDIWEDDDFTEEKFNLEDGVEGFNLYKDGKKLSPLVFSNGKSQEDIVNEIVSLIERGKKVIFLRGVCGTGKSAIALNIAKKLGKVSIVVPGKSLQKQYHEDYSKKDYVLKSDHRKLKIKFITGRQNHRCLYCRGENADFGELPCKIELKEYNFKKLKEYLKENSRVRDDLELKEIRRMSVAPVCPYWSPVIPSEYDFQLKSNKKKYLGLNNTEFIIHNRKIGCSYYNQFNSYVDADVIVFNSAKYKLETVMNRKPFTNVEIIDECDEFLDGFSNVQKINLTRLFNSLNNLFVDTEDLEFVLRKLRNILSEIVNSSEIKSAVNSEHIFELRLNEIIKLFETLLDNEDFINSVDDDNYVCSVYEICKEFSELLDDAFVSFDQEDRGLVASVVTTNLEKKFKELLDKNKAIVMMSGTIHSENVLKYVFALEDFEIIDAEVVNQGEIGVIETGKEIDCKYSNFKNGNHSREDYLVALDLAVEKSVKPTLVHVNSFDDLPSENEKSLYQLDNLMTKSRLFSLQENAGKFIGRFRSGEVSVLFTTKCGRGIDFPGEQCKSVIFTKYPNPHVRSLFWRILQKTHPQYYWTVYKDKARREFLQKIYRGVRSTTDHVFVLSPDKRVLDATRFIVNS
ncbi:MAG: helicase C-terminal domain-containing protein [Nanoarchaeota archaeon]|nr:helicase C-terminal domain-containing protein [Nanoarchaeota archaeon]